MKLLNQDRVLANVKLASKEQVVDSFKVHCRTIYKDSLNLSALNKYDKVSPEVAMQTFPKLAQIFHELSLMPLDPKVINILIQAVKRDARTQAKLIKKYL